MTTNSFKERKAAIIIGFIGSALYLLNGFLCFNAWFSSLSTPYWIIGSISLIGTLISFKFPRIGGIMNLLAMPITAIIFMILGQNYFMYLIITIPIPIVPVLLVVISGILLVLFPKKSATPQEGELHGV